jgi:hypothetical protein
VAICVFSLYVCVAVLNSPQVVCVCGSFLGLQRFSVSVSVWDNCFAPHAQHSSMQMLVPCGCGSMYRLLFGRETIIESKEAFDSTEQRNTGGHSHGPFKNPKPSPTSKPHNPAPAYKQFCQNKNPTKNAFLKHQNSQLRCLY